MTRFISLETFVLERTSTSYQRRFQRVLDHIGQNLDGELNLRALSQVAAFSEFHFHRQFSAWFGISASRFVKLKRLNLAAHQLAYRDSRIIDISLNCGYENPEAFSRVFKGFFSQTPSDFRKAPNWASWLVLINTLSEQRIIGVEHNYNNDDVEIVTFPETRIAVLAHMGDPKRIPETVRKFITWRKEHGLPPSKSATFNILHNDPSEVPASEYRFDICAEIKAAVMKNELGVYEDIIPSGLCAKLRHMGSSDHLHEAITYIYREWLPDSSSEPRDFPLFVQRVRSFPDCSEQDAITDVFLPIC